jgi:lipid A ethanolaminephosphotransferase
MSLKLFRSTGYSSILVPGETRVAMHPAWLALATSAWIAFACNVALWRALVSGEPGLGRALAVGVFTGAASGLVLSVLGWRRTLKPAASALLLLAAVAAAGLWTQAAPLDASLLARRFGALLPPWTSLLGWQVPLLLVVLGLAPLLWVWQAQLRRLPGPEQLTANAVGFAIAAALMAASGWLLLQGVV